MHLFTYGTLMDPEIMSHVAGAIFPSRMASLSGYRCRTVTGEVYPAIVPCPEEQVKGVVYFSLSTDAIDRLDRFEGNQYERQMVVVDSGGEQMNVQAYVLALEYYHLLSSSPWSLEKFQRTGKIIFSRHYTGFKRVQTLEEME